MKACIRNVGIIEDSCINVDGLTVITGQNNSGKTTIGKVLYSLFSAKENLFENATADIVTYSKKQITEIVRNSGLGYFLRRPPLNDMHQNEEFLMLVDAYKGDHPVLNSIDDVFAYILKFVHFIEQLTLSKMQNVFNTEGKTGLKYNDDVEFQNTTKEIIEELISLNEKIKKLSDLDFYESIKIINALTREFNRQISPVKLPERSISSIKLIAESDSFEIIIDNNNKKISTKGYFGFEDINNVVFVDDVTIIDNVDPRYGEILNIRRRMNQNEELSDIVYTLDHKYSLIYKLSKSTHIIENIVDQDFLEQIMDKISHVLSDDIVIRDNCYVCSSDNLNLSNLAMGAKVFAILKMLLSNGGINNKTLLILDEPESHLHPMWQNVVAEIIVLLIKNLGTKMVITSHSPNFVLALQTYAIKYKLEGVTNFYSTQKKKDGYLVDYKPMNTDLNKIYAEFARPFSEMKAIFDSIKCGEGND